MEFSILLLNKSTVVSFSPEYGSDGTSLILGIWILQVEPICQEPREKWKITFSASPLIEP